MPTLTAQYLAEHAKTVQTYDSFGRSLVNAALAQAKAQVGTGQFGRS